MLQNEKKKKGKKETPPNATAAEIAEMQVVHRLAMKLKSGDGWSFLLSCLTRFTPCPDTSIMTARAIVMHSNSESPECVIWKAYQDAISLNTISVAHTLHGECARAIWDLVNQRAHARGGKFSPNIVAFASLEQAVNAGWEEMQEKRDFALSKMQAKCVFSSGRRAVPIECLLIALPYVTHLNVTECKGTGLPPKIVQALTDGEAGKLASLELTNCKNLTDFNPLQGVMDTLTSLTLSFLSSNLYVLPPCIFQLHLKTLVIEGCKIRQIFDVEKLHTSKKLEVLCIQQGLRGPAWIESRQFDDILDLSGHRARLIELMHRETARGLSRLEELRIKHCDSLAELPAFVFMIPNLSFLQLDFMRVSKFRLVTNGPSNLKSLYVTYCSLLRELPPNISELSSLSELNLLGCNQLHELPDLGDMGLRTLVLPNSNVRHHLVDAYEMSYRDTGSGELVLQAMARRKHPAKLLVLIMVSRRRLSRHLPDELWLIILCEFLNVTNVFG